MRYFPHLTNYKFRHSVLAEDGERYISWMSDIGEIPVGQIPIDSRAADELWLDAPWLGNTLVDEGEEDILDVYLRGATAPTSFYLRLYNDTCAETDTLATLQNEVTGTGYPGTHTIARNSTGWPTFAQDGGDWKATSLTISWTNSGGGAWTAATTSVLATVTTGTAGLFIAYRDLSATRTLQPSDQLDCYIGVKLA